MLPALFDPTCNQLGARKEGERRVWERHAPADAASLEGLSFFPLPERTAGTSRVVLVDESERAFTLAEPGRRGQRACGRAVLVRRLVPDGALR
jgi:hypothetical protein